MIDHKSEGCCVGTDRMTKGRLTKVLVTRIGQLKAKELWIGLLKSKY